jgi:hypothetical protein
VSHPDYPALGRHRLDAEGVHKSAAMFGKLVAQRLVDPDDAMKALLLAAKRAGYAGNFRGLRTRLSHVLHDHAHNWITAACEADIAVRKVIAPFIRARKSAIPAAMFENEQRGAPLQPDAVRGIVAEEEAWWIRQGEPA